MDGRSDQQQPGPTAIQTVFIIVHCCLLLIIDSQSLHVASKPQKKKEKLLMPFCRYSFIVTPHALQFNEPPDSHYSVSQHVLIFNNTVTFSKQ